VAVLDFNQSKSESLPSHWLARRQGGLLSARCGATAMEFAILAIPFWLFMLFLFELGCDFYVQLALDYAVQEGARALQTGQVAPTASATVFKTDCLCPAVAGFLNCSQIALNVYPVTTTDYYTNAQAGAGFVPTSSGSLSTGSWSFTTGTANTPMFLQAVYTSVSIVGQLFPAMSILNGNVRVHVTTSSVGFLNEEYPTLTTFCGKTT
jgi:Flp pilus assembly protein TadG